MTTAMEVMLAVIAVSAVLTFVRLVRGPTLADRVVALDLLTIVGVAAMSVAAIRYQVEALMDVALVLALIGFIGTAALASYIERKGGR
jgi:multicomponent Na+:H+ antiporter subunit F